MWEVTPTLPSRGRVAGHAPQRIRGVPKTHHPSFEIEGDSVSYTGKSHRQTTLTDRLVGVRDLTACTQFTQELVHDLTVIAKKQFRLNAQVDAAAHVSHSSQLHSVFYLDSMTDPAIVCHKKHKRAQKVKCDNLIQLCDVERETSFAIHKYR